MLQLTLVITVHTVLFYRMDGVMLLSVIRQWDNWQHSEHAMPQQFIHGQEYFLVIIGACDVQTPGWFIRQSILSMTNL